MSAATNGRITRDDIEARFRALEADVTEKGEQAKSYLIAGAAAALLVVVAVAFLAGRRRGVKSSTVVEIRRI